MNQKELRGRFEDTELFQKKYESLLSVCDLNGTMISQDRLLENDNDIFPYRFFRRGTREYVFPKQIPAQSIDSSKIIDSSVDYGLRTEKQEFVFDEKKVEGRIRIEYKDSDNVPVLKVRDVSRDSKLPESVKKTLEEIFGK